MFLKERLQRGANILWPGSALSLGQIDEGVDAFEYRGQLACRFIQQEHHIVEALGADSDDSQINGEGIAGAHLPDKMGVVFEVHGSRFAATVVGIAEADGRIESVTSVIEHGYKVPDVHVFVAVCPFGARNCLVTGRAQFPNLFRGEMGWLHGSYFYHG